ncbi:MAG TPA: Ppx/GppA phosphatase family protein [Candidatus Eisenbacteria bacterium]|jgi:exopolyphosphatase/guanosine-5'-triphosphate,3'-diphosphate pyrophosphatase|nr:Ppx/GppA phosphatase family protein [Candidatus Eisenbacteria bacterium]
MKIAVFDIGTNSIHMLIVEIRDDLSFEILDHEKDTTRLGDGSFEKKRLAKTTMRRALEVLDRFAKLARKSGAKKTVAVATSAVREAKNSGEFLHMIERRTGIRVRVITGEEEARLIFMAARSSVETRGEKVLVVDIGGGSVELVLGDAKDTPFLASYKLGVARLTDRFISTDPPSKKELRALEEHVESELKKPSKRIRKIGFSMVIGTAGTMVALAAMTYQDKKKRPLQLFNHFELSRKDLLRVHEKLVRMPWKERLKLPGLEAKRADIIVAGSVLVTALMRLLKVKRITISDKGIREGIILDFIEKNRKGLKTRPGEEALSIRERSVRQLARRFAANEAHAEQVARLAVELFDRTVTLHRLGDRERDLLKYSSLLHDIGYSISFKKHHKHSHYLIVNSDLDGFSPEEVEIMGAVARHHRKPLGKKKEGHFVSRSGKYTIKVLSSLLRIADGLDRSHFSVIESMDCRVTPGSVVLTLHARRDAELEVWQAGARADLFEKVFKRKLVILAGSAKK